MSLDLIRHEDRETLIDSINSENNKTRKQWSLRQFEVQSGRMQQYVKEDLLSQLDRDSVKEMPIVSSINVQKAVVDKKATIYKKRPTRRFSELNNDQTKTMELIYKDMDLDEKLNKANKGYTYQDQTIGMIIPKGGKLICRVFTMHQIDAIPSMLDPESSDGFIISAFDRTLYIENDTERKEIETATGYRGRSTRSTASQDQDLEVSEKYQFQKYVEKYIVWTNEYNFMMNGLGEILDPETLEESNEVDIISPLASEGIMPFFEVSRDKDFEFFTRASNSLTDFTIQFNTELSDLANNIKMNGYAVGVLKAPSDIQPESQVIGASYLLKLHTDDPEKVVDFSFASPNSNIGEISDAIDKLLNYFVTSEGVGGDVVNSSGMQEKAQSGIDRYLMMLSKLESHSDDYDKFNNVEIRIYEIIKAWLRVSATTNDLLPKYKMTVPESSEIEVEYYKPEMIQTETEKLSNIEKRIDMGLVSKKMAVKEYYDIEDDEAAQAILDEIQESEELRLPMEGFNGGVRGEENNNEDEDDPEGES